MDRRGGGLTGTRTAAGRGAVGRLTASSGPGTGAGRPRSRGRSGRGVQREIATIRARSCAGSSSQLARDRACQTWTSRRTGASSGSASTAESIPSRRSAEDGVRRARSAFARLGVRPARPTPGPAGDAAGGAAAQGYSGSPRSPGTDGLSSSCSHQIPASRAQSTGPPASIDARTPGGRWSRPRRAPRAASGPADTSGRWPLRRR